VARLRRGQNKSRGFKEIRWNPFWGGNVSYIDHPV
jgi:hypothetical protein